MKKLTSNKKLVVGRETVRALAPDELRVIDGGAEAGRPPKQPVSTDSVNVCCA